MCSSFSKCLYDSVFRGQFWFFICCLVSELINHLQVQHCELGLKNSNYNADLVLQESGVSIGTNFTQVEGRILQEPKLRVGNGEDFQPYNRRWNFNNRFDRLCLFSSVD
ncbi:hypothetical protein Bca52824_025747 [Brassica carinata]|uniref:Argonaute linker 2 domain-containing protein n=1 Tax=Brassica carinata TaxID=52824 RepID=A0A8X7V865_BRACI|nr:hypothetical protein Bca52824_025747 [Brassica carinata]